jgi:hypothetical protein
MKSGQLHYENIELLNTLLKQKVKDGEQLSSEDLSIIQKMSDKK